MACRVTTSSPPPAWRFSRVFLKITAPHQRGKPSKGTGRLQSQWLGGYGDKSTHRYCQLLAHQLINSSLPAWAQRASPINAEDRFAPANTAPASAPADQTISYPSTAQPERRVGAAAPSHTHEILSPPQKSSRREGKLAHSRSEQPPPALTPQLEPEGLSPPASPPHAEPGAQTVPFSTFLAPNSLLSPLPRCQRLFFS